MSYHLNSAISHVSSGVKVFAERQDSENRLASESIPSEILNPYYTRLDTQGLELDESTFLGQQRLHCWERRYFSDFESIDEAQHTFDDITNTIIHGMYEISSQWLSWDVHEAGVTGQDLATPLRDLLSTYLSWCDAFDQYVDGCVDQNNIAACLVLQLWRILININLQVDLQKGEMDFDNFTAGFEAIVNLAIEFMRIQSDHQGDQIATNAETASLAKSELRVLHHSGASGRGFLSGYLGIHPRITPLHVMNQEDALKVHKTSSALLQIPRALRDGPAEALDCLDEPPGPPTPRTPSFSISPGIVSPLFVTITRSRDPRVRRRALLLMQQCKRREGLWDSALAARLSGRVVQIEEQRAKELNGGMSEDLTVAINASTITSASQICNEARVRMIKPTFLPERRSIERYYLGWSGPLLDAQQQGETWIEELMEW